MTVRYYALVEDTSGVGVDIIDNPLSFSFGLGYSKRNLLTLNISAYQEYNLQPDYLIRLYRKDDLVSDEWFNVGNFINKTDTFTIGESSRKTRTIYAASPEEIIHKSAIAYRAGDNKTQKSGDVVQVMAAYVRQNCGVDATTGNGRYTNNVNPITVNTPAPIGVSWSGSRSNKMLIDVCQELVEFARDNGVRADFRVDYLGGYQFEFVAGVLGKDRTTNGINPATGLNGVGNAPIVVSPQLDNMRYFNETFARMNEANVVFGLGPGEAQERVITVSEIAESRNRSPLSQRERFISATGENASGVQQKSDAEVQQWVGKNNFIIYPDPSKLRLFVDYNVGDLITVENESGQRFTRQVLSADVTVDSAGNGFTERYLIDFDDT